MKISLILATVGRVSEVNVFLDSLVHQTYKNFEIILVDQNEDNRLENTINQYRILFEIKHIKSEKGLSKARNVGLRHASGDIYTFPDDDCWYANDLLKRAVMLLNEHPTWDGFTGKCENGKGQSTVTRWINSARYIDSINAWRTTTSISIFLKRNVIKTIGNFDVTLGAGASTMWGSGEDIDYIIRVVKNGYRIFYEPSFIVFHHQDIIVYDENAYIRAFKYSSGMGRVLRKHKFPLWFVGYNWLRSLGGIILSCLCCNIPKSRYHWMTLKGRIQGWLA